jgi:hypothetical protein
MTLALESMDQAAIQWGAVLGASLIAAVFDRTGLIRTWPALVLLMVVSLFINAWIGRMPPAEAFPVSVVLALAFFCLTKDKRRFEVAEYAFIVAVIVVGTMLTRALIGIQRGEFPS